MDHILEKINELLSDRQEEKLEMSQKEVKEQEFRELVLSMRNEDRQVVSKLEQTIAETKKIMENWTREKDVSPPNNDKPDEGDIITYNDIMPGPSGTQEHNCGRNNFPIVQLYESTVSNMGESSDLNPKNNQFQEGRKTPSGVEPRDIIYINHNNKPHPTEMFSSEKEMCPISFISTLEVKLQRERNTTGFKNIIKRHLSNEAYYWFVVSEPDINTFNDFKIKFVEEFWSVERQEFILSKLESGKYVAKADVSKVQYIYALVARVRAVTQTLDESSIVRKLARHFEAAFQLWYEMRKPKNISEFVSLMKDYEKFSSQVGESQTSKINKNKPAETPRSPNDFTNNNDTQALKQFQPQGNVGYPTYVRRYNGNPRGSGYQTYRQQYNPNNNRYPRPFNNNNQGFSNGPPRPFPGPPNIRQNYQGSRPRYGNDPGLCYIQPSGQNPYLNG